jgi:hypothetical protein
MPLDATTPPPEGGQGTNPATEPAQNVTISQEQLQQFVAAQAQLAQMQSEQRQREEAAQEEQARLLAAKGETEKALQTIQQQSEARLKAETDQRLRTEDRAKRYALDNELQKALAMHPLVPGTVDQLAAILRPQLQVEAQGDSYSVRTPAFVSAIDHVAATLAKPEFAHFLRPQGTGGTAGTGASQSAPTPSANPAPPAQPKNFGEAIILQMQDIAKNKQQVNPATDMSKGFGLGRGTPAAKQA